MSVSMFDTRVMLQALEMMPPVRTFLRDTFFRNVRTFDVAKVDVDIVKGKRKVAAYVHPNAQGKLVTREGFTTNTYEPPYIKEKMVTTAADILKRQPGENIYGSKSPTEKARIQLAKDLQYLNDRVTRAEEVQASQALFLGEVTVTNGDKIAFGMDTTHKVTLTSTDLWTDTTNSKPLDKLRTWKQMLVKDSGLAPDFLLMGASAYTAFMNHPKTKDGSGAVSSIKVTLGQINPQDLPNGATYVGYLTELGLDIYTYDDIYLGTNDAETAFVPTDKILMGSTRARMDRLYGAILDLKSDFEGERFAKSWEEEDPSARFIMMQSAPLLCPHDVNSYMWAKVV